MQNTLFRRAARQAFTADRVFENFSSNRKMMLHKLAWRLKTIKLAMLQKVSRDDCLKKNPVFPLRHYDDISDEEDFIYPKAIPGKWMAIDTKDDTTFSTKLAEELTHLFTELGIQCLTFLGDTDQSWISKQGLKRKDYLPFSKAITYFTRHEISSSFNGGVIVSIDELKTFLTHFYTLVRCDASLPYFHFIDEKQQFLGTIHYSGQIRIDRFNEQADFMLERHISGTQFKVSPS
jgi:hypothetical protein